MIVSNGPARGYVREQMNTPGQAGQDTGSQRTIGSGHTKRKKTRDCRANRGEADRLSFPPSASSSSPSSHPTRTAHDLFRDHFRRAFLAAALCLFPSHSLSLQPVDDDSRVPSPSPRFVAMVKVTSWGKGRGGKEGCAKANEPIQSGCAVHLY